MSAEEINPKAEIEWGENQTPFSPLFDDFYYSTDSGLAETTYIFLEHNRIAERLAECQVVAERVEKSARLGSFCIVETGFGTGLNFLATLQVWHKLAESKTAPDLHFVSFEKYPLQKEALRKAHAVFPELSEWSDRLIEHYPLSLPGWHDLWLFEGKVRLTLWFGDVLKGLPECEFKVDAWYLDGFTPSRNPDMWQPSLYKEMARLSHLETTFATYTAAGDVRRGLMEAGFEVVKDTGFGQKREMCFGSLIHQRTYSPKWPWFSPVSPLKTAIEQTEICVVGVGLAGAAVAYQLAKMGARVRVLDAQPEPDWGQPSHNAAMASGNLAGAVHPLVTADWNLRSQFYLKGLETTLKWLKPWLDENEIHGNLEGLMQLAVDQTQLERLQDAFMRVNLPEDFAIWCNAKDVSALLEVETDFPGVLFPEGGWIDPASVVQKCLSHPNITVDWQQTVTDLNLIESASQPPAWQILTEINQLQAGAVVLCTGALNASLNERFGLPIRPVKGQVSHFSEQDALELPSLPVTHKGYTSPCVPRRDVVTGQTIVGVTGATFEAPDLNFGLSMDAHQQNLTQLSEAITTEMPEASSTFHLEQGKVGFRPTTPDHVPIIGAVADKDWTQDAYYSKSHTHAVFRYPNQQYFPGLFVSNGHGARGLMSVFLAAEMIAAEMFGEVQVLPRSLRELCHPERFKIRHWRSGKKADKNPL